MTRTAYRASRRRFLKNTSRAAAALALAGVAVPRVHAAEQHTIQVALVGCGGRGTGAAVNALSVQDGPIKLVALADVFPERVQASVEALDRECSAGMEVPTDRRFVGFDAYRHAMDCLKPGDVVILGTPPGFRWVHFTYAIEKGLHVFMEKPVAVDGPTSRRMFQLADQAAAKNLKVGVGLMCRHSRAMEELAQRIHGGEIGDLIHMRAYRMHGPLTNSYTPARPADISELLYQIKCFHGFLWAGGGCFSDFYIHVIDHCCWMKDAWPVKAQALGARHYRQSPEGEAYIDQNFDVYSVEYTFPDDTTLLMDGRTMVGCEPIYCSYAHGSKGMAIISKSGDYGMPSSTYRGQSPRPPHMLWQSQVPPREENPYQNEWNDLIDAIRHDKPFNEVKRGTEASLVTAMGRMAAHTGQAITYDQILNCPHEFAPDVDKLTMDSPAPLQAGPDGKYPVPLPGIVTQREY